MKKNMLLLTAIIAVSSTIYSAPETKTKTPTTTLKTAEVKVVEVKAPEKLPEVKVDKSKIISSFTGTIEYKTDLFGTESKDGATNNREYTTTVGGTTTTDKSSPNITEKTVSFLKLDNNTEEPKATLDLGARVFDDYDLKLSLKALYNKDEEDVAAGINKNAQESTTFAISRTWADAYVEWKSDIDLNENELFQALVKDSSFTIRKKIGIVEGQVKAGRVSDALGKGKYGIDTTTLDTYIKITPTKALTITLRPYDMNWITGKTFKNENLDRDSILASTDDTGTYLISENLSKSFDNEVTKVETPLSGVEAELKTDKVRYFGKLNTHMVNSKTVETTTLDGSDRLSQKEVEKSVNLKNYFITQIGAEIKINENSKYTVTSTLKLEGSGVTEKTTEDTTYVGTTATTVTTNSKDKDSTTNFGINAFGENKFGQIKLESELDFRYNKESNSSVTSATVSSDGETVNTMFGLYSKASFGSVKFVTPYTSIKYTNKAIKESLTGKTTATDTYDNSFSESYSKFEFAVGAEKTIQALTLGLDYTIANATQSESEATDSDTNSGVTTTQSDKGEKVNLGFTTLASFKVSYKF